MKHPSCPFPLPSFIVLIVLLVLCGACQNRTVTSSLPTQAAAANLISTMPAPTPTPQPPSRQPTPALPPVTPTATPTPLTWQRHAIQSGETLITIAAQYGLALDYLMATNYLVDANTIFVGQELLIPPLDAEGQRVLGLPAAAPPFTLATLGYSEQNRPIERYTFGDGASQIVFVGSMHGGYEWNTTVLAYQAIDYFTAFPQAVPPTVTLHIIPSANPDGLFLATGKEGRFTVQRIFRLVMR
ncbi:MAG: LysM peptidoglycan-binding domain-containing protein [Chloroflexi bacterium]|nr:LysM peptidoglycan-binding domain-containing protein [Chloroflexota bacterium]